MRLNLKRQLRAIRPWGAERDEQALPSKPRLPCSPLMFLPQVWPEPFVSQSGLTEDPLSHSSGPCEPLAF